MDQSKGNAQNFKRKSREALLTIENQEYDTTFKPSKMWSLKSNSCLL